MPPRSLFDGSEDAPTLGDKGGARAVVKPPEALTVAELVARLKGAIEPSFKSVWVAGEIAEFRLFASSGHAYFALKDANAMIRAKMWKSTLSRLKYIPENGAAVVAHGAVDFWAPKGELSLTIDKVIPQGIGELAAAFEQLRKKLANEGLFSEARKRALPRFPRAIGLVTSREGAAIRDFLRHLTERFPMRVVLAASAVQGAAAPESLASAIYQLSDNADAWGLDMIVVVRGGGGIEDLAAFNTEVVARAIVASTIPILTGIGHEIDTTIADLVADRRAKTPTDAADCAVPDRAALISGLTDSWERISLTADHAISNLEAELDSLEARVKASGPRAVVDRIGLEIASLARRMRANADRRVDRASGEVDRLRGRLRSSSPAARVAEWRRRFEALTQALRANAKARLALEERALSVGAARLHGVSPVAILGRGYSLARRRGDSALLRDTADVRLGETIETRLARGTFWSRVECVNIEPHDP